MRTAVLAAALGLAVPAAGAGEKDAFAKLAPNTWTPLGKVTYRFPKEYTGRYNQRFWCNLTWDSDSRRILFYEGYKGSHGHKYSIYANALYSLRPAEKTVGLVNLSTGWRSGGGWYRYQRTQSPPSPYPRHTWGALIHVPKYKRVYIGPGAAGAENGKKANTFWSYDIEKDTWTDVTGKRPGPTNYQTHFAHFGDSDILWIFSSRKGNWTNLYAFDMRKQDWAKEQVGRTRGFSVQHVAVDTKRKRALVRISSRQPFASNFSIFDPGKKTLTPIRHPKEITRKARMAYIPRHDTFFIHDPEGGKDWICNPGKGEFRPIEASNGDKLRMDNYLAYDPVNDIVVIYTISGQFKVFRYVPAKDPAAEKADRQKASVRHLCDLAVSHPRPAGAPKRSDVSMRLFRRHKEGKEIEAGKAFHITRADWSYILDADYTRKVQELGWSFQGTMNAVTHKPEHAIKLRNGKPMLDHFGKPGRYWADMKNEDYRTWYVERLKAWVDAGAESIQRDEPTTCGRTPVRTAVAFFKNVHQRFEKLVAKKVPLSCNMKLSFSSGGREPVNRLFDFGMAEFYRQYLKPALIIGAARDAERRGKGLIYTGGGSMSTQEIRTAIAGCYANGISYIVPWDQFTGIRTPRLFAKPEDFADLYGFVRAVGEHLDGYEAAANHVSVALRHQEVRQNLANELFAGRAFTVVMVSQSKDSGFGVGGNSANGSGGIPRLYMTRGDFHYNVLKGAPAGSKPGEVEITTFVHDGKSRITVYRNGEPAGSRDGDEHAVKGSFGGGGFLSIPFHGGNRNHPGRLAELLAFRGDLPADRLKALHAVLKRNYLTDGAEAVPIPDKILGPELILHLSADDLATTHKKGQAVTKWPARTRQFAVVPRIRLPGGKQASPPTFKPGAVNGRAAVLFDGADDLVRIVSTKVSSGDSPVSVLAGTGSGRLCVFARAKPGDANAPVVLHLVEWMSRPKPATLLLRREAFFGDKALRVRLLTPAPYDKASHDKAEADKDYAPLAKRTDLKVTSKDGLVHVAVPALRPWGLLVVSPSE